jgi:hypothetical protein
VSRKKAVNHGTRSISTHVSIYTADAEEMPELAAKLGVTRSDQVFLHFEKHAFTGGGARVNTFGSRGLSGEGLLDLGEFNSPESYARDPERSAGCWCQRFAMVLIAVRQLELGQSTGPRSSSTISRSLNRA